MVKRFNQNTEEAELRPGRISCWYPRRYGKAVFISSQSLVLSWLFTFEVKVHNGILGCISRSVTNQTRELLSSPLTQHCQMVEGDDPSSLLSNATICLAHFPQGFLPPYHTHTADKALLHIFQQSCFVFL